MSAAAVIPSLLPLFMVMAMRRAEGRIRTQLVDAGAFTAQTAIPLSPTRSLDKRRLQGLVSGGAVRVSTDSRHYLDEEGWSTYARNRRRRALLALSVTVALLGVVFAAAFLMR